MQRLQGFGVGHAFLRMLADGPNHYASHEPHQGIDRHDALAAGRTISGLISASATPAIVGEPRERHDGVRQRLEVALGLAAIAGERGSRAPRRSSRARRRDRLAPAAGCGRARSRSRRRPPPPSPAGRRRGRRDSRSEPRRAPRPSAAPARARRACRAFARRRRADAPIAATSAVPSATPSTTPTSLLCAISAERTLTATG